MGYQIIQNVNILNRFVEWLPALRENEKFYCSLFSRKKYSFTSSGPGSLQLDRFVCTKDSLIEKLRRLEVPYGGYLYKGKEVEQETLAVYINPNPRDLLAASYDGLCELSKGLKNNHQNINPHQEMMSCIQRSIGQKPFLDFDIDDPNFDLYSLHDVINPDCLHIVRTRGGYHILVELSLIKDEYKKTFRQKIVSLGADQVGDQLLPIPGCIHGGFVPHFVDITETRKA